jgi:repressor LexA
MLTPKQYELLIFLDRRLRETGYCPSFEEMKHALDLRSKSGIHRLISALEERGFVKRRHNRARALEVVRLPENMTRRAVMPEPEVAGAEPGRAFAPRVIRGDFTARIPAVRSATETPAVTLPLYGRIAAGLPIEALQDASATLAVPTAMIGAGDHYALEVAGDSMVDAGILDGDMVVIRRDETAENGQIVVALIDDSEVTLKRMRRRGNSIALEPANPRYETRIFPAERVKLQGRLVALMRRF